MASEVFLPTNTKGLCGRCGKTRGMHHFVEEGNSGLVTVYCTPTKKGDAPVAATDSDLAALWEPNPSQCSSCGHTDGLHGGKYFYKVNEKYRYCIWCMGRGGRGNVMRLILVRQLAKQDCEDPKPSDCGKCLPCLARKWSDHPFA